MKKIENNPYNLNINDMDIITNKVRALIVDKDKNIILTKYADMFMLPGGKIDRNEDVKNALIRELKEELGIVFDKSEMEPLIQFENYLKNYPIVGSNDVKNKLNSTSYFVIKTNKDFDVTKIKLSEREKNNNFQIFKININDALNLIDNYKSNNPRNKYFKNEILRILKEYIHSQKLIDMHTHSCYSDGELSPNDLIKHAIKNNIGILSITDHDTLDGVKKINKNENFIIESGIKIINGIELSAKVDKGRMHILGYNIDINNKILNDKLNEIKDNNINYIILLLAQINKDYGINFNDEDIKNLFNSCGNLGRPDIAKLCVKYGYAKNVQDAFDKYLIPSYENIRSFKKSLYYEECIQLILNSGGIPVLAHPKTLKLNEDELIKLIRSMINAGLRGIEVYHSTHNEKERNLYLNIAKEYNLLVSGGSDYHGKITKPDVEIGTGINNNLKIKRLSLVDNIIY